ncbi:MAG TPA: hypothetical protein VN782_12265 [Usitatibacter sp.]|nr:hypothetical protein [Usitatibacter sp.]
MAISGLPPPPELTDTGFKGWLFRMWSAITTIGYAQGSGGAVTQATSKSTGVTLNAICGQVTMNAAALVSGAKVTFVVTDSLCAATDIPLPCVASGGVANAYRVSCTAVAGGSFSLTVENITAGSLSESPVISFVIFKAVAA